MPPCAWRLCMAFSAGHFFCLQVPDFFHHLMEELWRRMSARLSRASSLIFPTG